MNLETFNLAPRWTAVSTNEENAKVGEMCANDPRNFKFDKEMDSSKH